MLRSSLKSLFSQWLPWLHKWNPARCVELHIKLGKSFSCIPFSAQKPLSTVHFTKALIHVPLAQVFTEQKYFDCKLIANYLTKQRPRRYLYSTKEESGTLRAKWNAQGHPSQWESCEEPCPSTYTTGRQYYLQESPFGLTLTHMQACICRTGILWQLDTADIYPQ